MECEKILSELREDAISIITAVWRGIDWDGVSSRRRMGIYEEYSNKIKSSSDTGRITHFIEKLTQKMGSSIPEKEIQGTLAIIRKIETADLDTEFLDVCRSDTSYIVMTMRERNDELRENSKQMILGA